MPIDAQPDGTLWSQANRPVTCARFTSTCVRGAARTAASSTTSPRNTDLLGWVMERSAGRRYADLMSELVWRQMGAARSAYITVDRLGAPRCAGGMCTTVRDLARVGQLIVDRGTRGGMQVVPAEWIDDIVGNGDAEAWAAGNLAHYFPHRAMHYRSQ
jgi:CubicO group peptidase (beta-lactamase class C family)